MDGFPKRRIDGDGGFKIFEGKFVVAGFDIFFAALVIGPGFELAAVGGVLGLGALLDAFFAQADDQAEIVGAGGDFRFGEGVFDRLVGGF